MSHREYDWKIFIRNGRIPIRSTKTESNENFNSSGFYSITSFGFKIKKKIYRRFRPLFKQKIWLNFFWIKQSQRQMINFLIIWVKQMSIACFYFGIDKVCERNSISNKPSKHFFFDKSIENYLRWTKVMRNG